MGQDNRSEDSGNGARRIDWSSIASVVSTCCGDGAGVGAQRDTRFPAVLECCWADLRKTADDTLLATVLSGGADSYAPCPIHGNGPCAPRTPARHTHDSVPSTNGSMPSLRLLATIDRASRGAAVSANRVGYTICEAVTSGWRNLPSKNAERVTAGEPALFHDERWRQTAMRSARKRLLDRSSVPGYRDYSAQMGYSHNVGRHSNVHVAWPGWYILSSGGPGGVPLTRARRIGDVEQLGLANWASLRAFEHPEFSGVAADIRAVLETEGWADDAALVSALWGCHYQDVKRMRQDAGEWPRQVEGAWHRSHGWLQLMENVAMGAVRLSAEHGAAAQEVVVRSVMWRRYNDVLDVVTDIVTGESNNVAAALLRPRLSQPYQRAQAAEELMRYHRETIMLRNSLLARSGRSALRRQMTTGVAIWYLWMARYNAWHKYLLARRYLTIAGTRLPAVRWDMVDIDHIRALYAGCGAGCVEALVELAERGKRSSQAVTTAGPTTKVLYTALVCGVEGIELCAHRDCDCSDRIAEYLDAEIGGEYCQWVTEMVREDRDKTDTYQMLNNYVDSESFSIFAMGAYASAYMAPELIQLPTGSRFDDSTRQSWL